MNHIKSFSVYGLFGSKDVHIPFKNIAKILIGENGIGKTQVLNIFYYTLTKNFIKLNEFSFINIEIEFLESTIKISKSELEGYINDVYRHPIIKEIIEKIGISEFETLKNFILLRNRGSYSTKSIFNLDNQHPLIKKIRHIAPLEYIVEAITDMHKMHISNINKKNKPKVYSPNLKPNNLEDCTRQIDKYLGKNSILYFPTFRRVEEDLHNLGYDDDKSFSNNEDNLIHFGMEDVQRRFDSYEKKIDLLLKEGFAKISGEILSKLVKGFGNTNKDILDRIDENDIDIILARIGTQIVESDKATIRKMVLEKKVADQDSAQLYFLQILIEIYEKQKESESSIKTFRDICNNYLIDKKVFYDESKIDIYIKQDDCAEPIPLSKLSSGEKQIISIFSKFYLSDDEQKFIVLFDEPELSLSMKWQKLLLPDILNSNKCVFLLAVTHSPFIFDNELDKFAIGLNEYMKPCKHQKLLA